MAKKETYLLPIWVDIVSDRPSDTIIKHLNTRLTEFFEEYGQTVEDNGDSISIQWSVNKHINLRERDTR